MTEKQLAQTVEALRTALLEKPEYSIVTRSLARLLALCDKPTRDEIHKTADELSRRTGRGGVGTLPRCCRKRRYENPFAPRVTLVRWDMNNGHFHPRRAVA